MASPLSWRSSSCIIFLIQWGMTICASPPVATTLTLAHSSFSIRATMPSTIDAVPCIIPLFMHSLVFVPMQLLGASKFTDGSWDVPHPSAFADIFNPGAIMPPRKTELHPTTEIVVAVPKSTTTMGNGYFAAAATQSAIRSHPSFSGLSAEKLSPVFSFELTIRGSSLVMAWTASESTAVRGRTTELMTAPSSSAGSVLSLSIIFLRQPLKTKIF